MRRPKEQFQPNHRCVGRLFPESNRGNDGSYSYFKQIFSGWKPARPPAGGDCQIQAGMSLYCADCWTSSHSYCPWLWAICRRVICLCKSRLTVLCRRIPHIKVNLLLSKRGKKITRGNVRGWNRVINVFLVVIIGRGTRDPLAPQCRPSLSVPSYK